MADRTVEVALRAIDETSGPAMSAAGALTTFSDSVGKASIASKQLTDSGTQTVGMMDLLEGRAMHRFEHTGMNVMIGQMAMMAGAAGPAGGALHLIEAGLFAVTSAAGLLSGPMVLVVAALAGIALACGNSSKEEAKLTEQTKTVCEQLDQLSGRAKSAEQKVLDLANAQLVALNAELASAKAHEESVKALAESAVAGDGAEFALKGVGTAADSTVGKIGRLKEGIDSIRSSMSELASKDAKDMAQAHQEAIDKMASGEQLFVARTAQLWDEMKAHNVDKWFEFQTDVADINDRMYQNWKDVQKKMRDEQDATADAAARSMAKMYKQIEPTFEAIGAAAADMAMKTQGAVAAMATAIVDTVEKMAMMVIADWMGVADAAAIANTIEEEGIWALAGAAVTLAAVAAVFEGIKSLIPKEKFSAPTTAVSNTPGTTSAVGGLGGSAVSSSQQMITNNVSVNLGLQALDLASVSDSQLQNLVYRLGRLLKQAAATGQFSLG